MKKTYRPFHQLPFCCVPATIQWILYRRNIDIMDQETIGVALGLRMPERFRYLLNNSNIVILPDSSKAFGTQILIAKFSIDNFFKNNNIPLKISEEYKFNNIKELEEFILDNIKTNRDIILRFNNFIFNSKKGVGHFAIIISYDERSKNVMIGDPDPPFFKSTSLEKIFESISDIQDGIRRGLYLVDETDDG